MSPLSDAEIRDLQAALPPLGDASSEATAARLESAVAGVCALHPADAQERALAIAWALTHYQMMECMRLAGLPDIDPKMRDRNRATALAMSRQSNASLRLLRTIQRGRGATVPRTEAVAAPEEAKPSPIPSVQENLPPDLAPVRQAVAMAEDFARRFPSRAARIRRAKGLPEGINYEPPHPAIVDVIAFGMTRALRRLDRLPV